MTNEQYRRAASKLMKLATSILQCTDLSERSDGVLLAVTIQQRENSIKELAKAAQRLRERSKS